MGNSNISKEPDNHSSGNGPSQSKFFIILNSTTWKKESYGLYDYECKSFVAKEQFKIYSPTYIVRHKDEIKVLKEKNMELEQSHLLGKVTNKNGDFYLEAPNYDLLQSNLITQKKIFEEGHQYCLWSIIRNSKDTIPIKYPLARRDCIKMGRVKIRVRDLKSEKPKASLGNKKALMKSKEQLEENIIFCRICLVEDTEIDNPFIIPCDCSGTMKYVHVKCIQKWLKNRLTTTTRPLCSSIEWKPLDCELCQSRFPDYLKGPDGVMYELVEIPKPDNEYIILEILNKETNVIEVIQIINMATKSTIKIGRGVDTDLRINDISVSRIHAFIKLENGVFYLEDNQSKFGTLVLINKPIPLNKLNNNLELQSGRTLLKFNIKKKQTTGFSCFGNKFEKSSLSPDIKRELPLELKNPPKKKPTANSLPASDRYQIDQINYHEQEMVIMPEIIQKKPENQPKKELIIPPIAQLQLQIEPIGIINFNDSDDEENHN